MQVSRAAYMSLFVYQEHAPISEICAKDVRSCTSRNPLIVHYPGKVLDCLDKKSARFFNSTSSMAPANKKLSIECERLVMVAEPPDDKESFDGQFQVRLCPGHEC